MNNLVQKRLVNKDRVGIGVLALAFLGLVAAFALLPLPGGDDWQTFYGAARRVLTGTPLYGTKITFSYFYNPPWLAVLLAPLGMLPFRWGWSIISVLSILNIFLLCRRWNMGAIKLVVSLLSPPLLYTLLHGNIDAFILGAVLLPKEAWVIAALTKPQTAVALSIGALRASWRKTLLLTGGIILFSFILFGNWITAFIAQPVDMINAGHNVFRGLWPYQVLVGGVLAFLGWKHQDERYLIGASPFFSPYAATSTMIGPWMLLISKLKDWQAIAALILYWGGAILMTQT